MTSKSREAQREGIPIKDLAKVATWIGTEIRLLRPHLRYNYVLYAAITVSSGLVLWLSYQLRFDFRVPDRYSAQFISVVPYVVLLKIGLFYAMRGHVSNWRYVGLRDMIRIGLYSIICALVLVSLSFVFSIGIPRGVIGIDAVITVVLTGGLRVSGRFIREQLGFTFRSDERPRKHSTVVIGAGDAGEMLIREIKRNPRSRYDVQAIFDDDSRMRDLRIHGVPVLGSVPEARLYVDDHAVQNVIVAIPSATAPQMRRIKGIFRDTDAAIATMPALHELIERAPVVRQLRKIDITDLLGREEVQINSEQVSHLIQDKVVLVTGAGGSIGSELCRQVRNRNPRKLILLERSENSLFKIDRNLAELFHNSSDHAVIPLLCDLRDQETLAYQLEKHKPDLVLHAAAYKHVDMQERNPFECFKNNVGSFRNLVLECDRLGVERLLLISTDKAVNPVSVMGATKRVCELYCQAFSEISATKFMSVRFGNVLASEGSVIPIFLNQIAKGGPVTVTHPDVTRYFMTIPEAVMLVLQAVAVGQPGWIMLLDMGEPVRILDLTRQLITLAGKSEDEIAIEFTGLRPGEKLLEELTCAGEECLKTSHPKISVYNKSVENPRDIIQKIDDSVERVSSSGNSVPLRAILQEIIPEYRPPTPTTPTGSNDD